MRARAAAARAARFALLVYALLFFGLVAAYVRRASSEVKTALYLTAPATLVRGEPNAARGLLSDAPTGRPIARVHDLEWSLWRGDQRLAHDRPIPGAGGVFHASLVPPAGLALGEGYELRLIARRAPGEEAFVASAPVRIVEPGSAPLERVEQVPEEERAREKRGVVERSGALRLETIPAEPVLARDLPGEIFVRAIEVSSDRALAGCAIERISAEGIDRARAPEGWRTGALGLVAIAVHPRSTLVWELEARCPAPGGGELRGSARVQIPTAPAGIALKAPAWGGLQARGALEGGARSVRARGPLFIDLYDGRRFAWGGAFGVEGGRAGWRVPQAGAGQGSVVRVQAYSTLWGPGNEWDVAWAARTERDAAGLEGAIEALEALVGRVEPGWRGAAWREASGAERALWARALAAALPKSFARPAPLMNTLRADRAAHAASRRAALSELRALIGAAVLIGLIALLWGVLEAARGAAARRRLVEAIVAEEGERAPTDSRAARLERWGRWALGALLISTIAWFGLVFVWMLGFWA